MRKIKEEIKQEVTEEYLKEDEDKKEEIIW